MMSERDATGRFEIERTSADDAPRENWVLRSCGGDKVWMSRTDGEALRDLLLRVFPVQCQSKRTVDIGQGPWGRATSGFQRCTQDAGHDEPCFPEPPQEPRPDEPELDDDEVRDLRRIIGLHDADNGHLLLRAARAYLRMHEQCPATFMGQRCGQPNQHHGLHDNQQQPAPAPTIAQVADTPESALRQLYDDAVQRLTRQRDEAAEKLRKLGGGA